MKLNLGRIVLPHQNRTVSHTVVTAAGGSYNDNGEWEGATAEPVSIQATIQPVTGQQLLDMPEGIRAEAKSTLWTRAVVNINDQIRSAGKSYRVIFVWDRDFEGGFHRAALGMLRNG